MRGRLFVAVLLTTFIRPPIGLWNPAWGSPEHRATWDGALEALTVARYGRHVASLPGLCAAELYEAGLEAAEVDDVMSDYGLDVLKEACDVD